MFGVVFIERTFEYICHYKLKESKNFISSIKMVSTTLVPWKQILKLMASTTISSITRSENAPVNQGPINHT